MTSRKRAPTSTIGYGRPPVHSQFKPGQSGNPNGRPKSTSAPFSLLDIELRRPITITEGDVKKKMPIFQAALRRLMLSAAKGDTRSTLALFKLATTHFSEATKIPDGKHVMTTAERDKRILAIFAKAKRRQEMSIMKSNDVERK